MPVPLMRLYESGEINGEELLLLAKIDALQDPKEGGCWASNQYLAKWWRKTDNWVSKTVSKLKVLGLVRVIQLGDGKRIIKVQIGVFSKVSLDKSPTKVAKAKRENEAVNGHRASFDLKPPEIISEPPDLSPAVRSYALFTQARKFHVRSRLPKVIYAKGGQKGGWARSTLIQWQRRYCELTEAFGKEKVNKVMRFFLHHYDHSFAPEARTFPAFAEKWDRIEKWYRRQLKERGEDEEPSIEEEGQEEESTGTMTEEESRKYFDEVNNFDYDESEG